MTTPPSMQGPSSTPSDASARVHASMSSATSNEARLGALRQEIEATGAADRARLAVLTYEMGHVLENDLGNDGQAVKEYLAAYNFDPAFRPPLFALIRIFERRRSLNNLGRLLEAEVRSATNPAEKASALTDRAAWVEELLQKPDEAKALLREALQEDPSAIAASLSLERLLFGAGEREAAAELVAQRARYVSEPTLREALLLETAWDREGAGDVEGALAAAKEAVALARGSERSLSTLERIAKKHRKWTELASAYEARAGRGAERARGDEAAVEAGAFEIERAVTPEARAEAASAWRDAARVRLAKLEDAAGAVSAYNEAVALAPEDVLLRQERMVANERAGDLAAVGADVRALLDIGIRGRHAASLHFRLAEIALLSHDIDAARAALTDALAEDPESAAASAMLDDLLVDEGRTAERVDRLAASARAGGERRRAYLLAWHAAHLASAGSGTEPPSRSEEARALYALAISFADDKAPVLRDAYAAAARLGDGDFAREMAESLLKLELDDEERSALLYEERAALLASQPDRADALLRAGLVHGRAKLWAAYAARARGAERADMPLLAQAHRVLGDLAVDEEAIAAHLIASARASQRAGDGAAAEQALRTALDRVPGHPYAVALLEEILRERGDAAGVVALLRDAASAPAGSRGAEMSLLLAGAAAEAAGDFALAAKTYEEATDRDPSALSPLWSLRRLATVQGDQALLISALEGLAEREMRTGKPGPAALTVAEHYDVMLDQPSLAEAHLRAVMDDAEIGDAAAAMLAVLRGVDADLRILATERLAKTAEHGGDVAWTRERAGQLREAAPDSARTDEAVGALLLKRPTDPWGLWARAGMAGPQSADRGDAFLSLSGATEDAGAAADLALHGLRARLFALGEDANDDAVIQAAELAAQAPNSLAASIALDETLSPSDDAATRAEALGHRLAHASAHEIPALAAAHGRALLAAGNAEGAVASLQRALEADPDDLASWDALRCAARETGRWDLVVSAIEKLLALAEGGFKADLLEEAAAVSMDHLGKDADAERYLRAALAIDSRREIAYGRLQDLLRERNDANELLSVVSERIAVTSDPAELVKLHYEQARIRRSLGDREGALASLDALFALEQGHVGGLALAVETSVALSRYREAVEFLRALATADVPKAQKKMARFGAADFLEKKLGDPGAALSELEALEREGMGDLALLSRIADLGERAGLGEAAASALRRMVDASTGGERVKHARRLGQLHIARNDLDAARAVFREALEAEPGNWETARDLVACVPTEHRREALQVFDAAVRADLRRDVTDIEALRKLRSVAAWTGDSWREYAALSVAATLGEELADAETRARIKTETFERPTLQKVGNPFDQMSALDDHGVLFRVLSLLGETAVAVDRLELSNFGVGRGDRVSPKDPHRLRDEVTSIVRAFGVGVGDFYVGGRSPDRVAALYRADDPAVWVLGSEVRLPLSAEARFRVGAIAMGLRTGMAPFLERTPRDIARFVFAAAASVGAPLPASKSVQGLEELTRAIGKAMPRRTKGPLQEALRALPEGGAQLEAACRSAQYTTHRAGLVTALDLDASLRAILGRTVDRAALSGEGAARDLIEFWLFSSPLALARELGLPT